MDLAILKGKRYGRLRSEFIFRVRLGWKSIGGHERQREKDSIGRSFAGDDMLIAVSLVCGWGLQRREECSWDVHKEQVHEVMVVALLSTKEHAQGQQVRSLIERRYQSLQLNVHQRETHREDRSRSNGLECMAKGIISEEARTSIFNPTETAKTWVRV